MATPTETEIQDMIANAVHLFEELREFGHVDATNFLGLIDTLRASLETDFSPEVEAAIQVVRDTYAVTIDNVASVLFPLFLEYGKFLEEPAQDIVTIFGRLYDNFIDNTLRVTSRAFVFGTPVAAGFNVGDGALNRLTTDENGFDIENQTPDAKRAVCVLDKHSGATEDEEQFRLEGDTAERDRIKITGSGRTQILTALTGRDSAQFLSNPSFGNNVGGPGALTELVDWVPLSSIASFDVTEDPAEIFRTFDGEGTATALLIEANDTLSQDLATRLATFSPGVPIYARIAVDRLGTGADGTFTLSWGTSSIATVMTTLPASGYTKIIIPIGTASWFANANAQPLDIKLTMAGAATFGAAFDDIIIAPFTFFDGGWYALDGGETPFLLDDEFTFADTNAESVLQQWFWRAFGGYLPHDVGGPVTWADP